MAGKISVKHLQGQEHAMPQNSKEQPDTSESSDFWGSSSDKICHRKVTFSFQAEKLLSL